MLDWLKRKLGFGGSYSGEAYGAGDQAAHQKVRDEISGIGKLIEDAGGLERMTTVCYRVGALGGDIRYIQFVWCG